MSKSLGYVVVGAAVAAGVAVGVILSRTLLKPRLPKGAVKHVFLAKFKPGTDVEKVQAFIDAYRALPSKITTMHGFEWGMDVSVEDLHKGFTHVFITTFPNVSARDGYLKNSYHDEVVRLLKETDPEDMLVVDFNPAVEKSAYYR